MVTKVISKGQMLKNLRELLVLQIVVLRLIFCFATLTDAIVKFSGGGQELPLTPPYTSTPGTM